MQADFDSLARAHQAEQVRQAATIQTALSVLWDRTIVPSDLQGSFARFEVTARRLVNAGRTRGELTAQEYDDALRQLAGLEGTISVPRQPFENEATQRALYSTGYAHAVRRIGEGDDVATALVSAKVSLLRAAKRRTLQAGRQRLIDLTNADPDMDRVARVSDGKPCAFCAMLVSRGPVYTASTAGFRAHDGCGCSVRPVPRGDSGWSGDARTYRELYDKSAGLGGGGKQDFRNVFARARAAGELDHVLPDGSVRADFAPAA